jgi:hypothetical protein
MPPPPNDAPQETSSPVDNSSPTPNFDSSSLWSGVSSLSRPGDSTTTATGTSDSNSLDLSGSIYNNSILATIGRSPTATGTPDATTPPGTQPTGDAPPTPSPAAGAAAAEIQQGAQDRINQWNQEGVGQPRGGDNPGGNGVNQDAKELFALTNAATEALLADFAAQAEASEEAEENKDDDDNDGIKNPDDSDDNEDGVDDADDLNFNHLSDLQEAVDKEAADAAEREEANHDADEEEDITAEHNGEENTFDATASIGASRTALGPAESTVASEEAQVAAELNHTKPSGGAAHDSNSLLNTENALRLALDRLREAANNPTEAA